MDFETNVLEDSMKSLLPQGPTAQKSPQKVKRPLNAYNIYFLERQPKLKAENPTLSGNEVSKKIGQEWAGMDENSRRPYREQSKGIYEKFKRENPNYHYDKSSEKKMRHRDQIPSNGSFLQDFHGFSGYQDPESEEVDVNSVLLWIGALYLSKFVLQKSDAVEEIVQSVHAVPSTFDAPFDVGEN